MQINKKHSVDKIHCDFALVKIRITGGYKIMESDLGAKVKKLRISHGLTQEDVAKALDVTPGYISNVENGRNLMTLRMLSYYAELTGVSLDYLAGSVDKSYQNTALDNEIMQIVQKLDADTKEKLISTLRIWEKKEA